MTKLCVKFVCVCEVIVYERWYVTKLCVCDVCEVTVCERWYVTKLCVKFVCVCTV